MKYLMNLINFYLILFILLNTIFSLNLDIINEKSFSNLNYNKEVNSKGPNIIIDYSDEETIYLNGEYEKEIILNKENNKRFIFNINNSNYIYFFESGEINGYIHYDNDLPCPNLCAMQFNQSIHENILYINYYKNSSENNIIIKISSIKDYKGEIKSIKPYDLKIDKINPIKISKSIIIFESYKDYILYLKPIDNSIDIKCAEYNKEINNYDIININETYFRYCHNK